MILNKEHKVVLFPPGFQTVRNPPGVKYDPPSLFISRPFHFSVLLLSWKRKERLVVPLFFSSSSFSSSFRFFVLDCGAGATTPRSLPMLQTQFLLGAGHCPEKRGRNRRRVCVPVRDHLSIFCNCARDSSHATSGSSPSFSSLPS